MLTQPSRRFLTPLVLLGGLFVAGCGGDDGDTGAAQGGSNQGGSAGSGGSQGGSSGSGGSGGAQGGSGGGAGESWVPLVSGEWSMEAGDEGYVCVRHTVTEAMFIRGFRAVAPFGTHHTVLSMDDSSEPDGTYDCTGGMNGPSMLYGSGVGTTPLEFPEGIAVKLEAGDRIILNLHLFNATTNEITGISGIEVRTMAEADVVEEAQAVLAGKDQGLLVDTGESTQTGFCTAPQAVHVFAVMPHMHQLGRHMRVTALGATPTVVLDTEYDFEEQRFTMQDPPVLVGAGERLQVDCTYMNNTGSVVRYGESSLDEMCYAGTYIYPKLQTRGIVCNK